MNRVEFCRREASLLGEIARAQHGNESYPEWHRRWLDAVRELREAEHEHKDRLNAKREADEQRDWRQR